MFIRAVHAGTCGIVGAGTVQDGRNAGCRIVLTFVIVTDAARARLVLAGDADLPGRVLRLAEAETACCSFFSFTLTPLTAGPPYAGDDTAVVALDIEVPPARADVLAALVERAASACGAVS